MKKIFITLIISLIGINAFSQLTTTCATGTIKLKTQLIMILITVEVQ